MRSLLTISMPADMIKAIHQKAKALGLSVSEYMRRVWKFQSTFITEEELMEDIRIARAERKAGKLKVLRSFDDLDRT